MSSSLQVSLSADGDFGELPDAANSQYRDTTAADIRPSIGIFSEVFTEGLYGDTRTQNRLRRTLSASVCLILILAGSLVSVVFIFNTDAGTDAGSTLLFDNSTMLGTLDLSPSNNHGICVPAKDTVYLLWINGDLVATGVCYFFDSHQQSCKPGHAGTNYLRAECAHISFALAKRGCGPDLRCRRVVTGTECQLTVLGSDQQAPQCTSSGRGKMGKEDFMWIALEVQDSEHLDPSHQPGHSLTTCGFPAPARCSNCDGFMRGSEIAAVAVLVRGTPRLRNHARLRFPYIYNRHVRAWTST